MATPDPPPDKREGREYLFDMLTQMAQLATDCGELGIAAALTLMLQKRLDQLEEIAKELNRFGSDQKH